MQVNLKVVAEVYKRPEHAEGIGQYKMKVQLYPLQVYLPFRFMLFNPHSANYSLYPNSTMDQYQKKWVQNFEFSKNTDFFEYLLEEIISAVEEDTHIIITRKGSEEYV